MRLRIGRVGNDKKRMRSRIESEGGDKYHKNDKKRIRSMMGRVSGDKSVKGEYNEGNQTREKSDMKAKQKKTSRKITQVQN